MSKKNAKKKGLSRGLEHLLSDNNTINDEGKTNKKEIHEILLEDLKPNPYQPRKKFDDEALEELSESIKQQGIFQPLAVRKLIVGYEIIAGERRYRASKIAGLETVPCVIYDYDDAQMMEVALIENIQREDLSIIEEAKSYEMLLNNLEYTQSKLAEKVGKSRSHIANMLRILKLDEYILDLIEDNQITMGHVKILVTIEDKKKQKEIIQKILKNKLTVRDAENLANDVKKETGQKKPRVKKDSPHKRIENLMREKLGTKVKISGKDKGSIQIDFSTEEELETLLELLNVI